jgi:hypothetical protein
MKQRGRKHIDLTGQQFGRLVALAYVSPSKWLCGCECGTMTTVPAGGLKSGNTKSCGCLRRDRGRRLGRRLRPPRGSSTKTKKADDTAIWFNEDCRDAYFNGPDYVSYD